MNNLTEQQADVLRAIDSCGGGFGPEQPEWGAGFNAALVARATLDLDGEKA